MDVTCRLRLRLLPDRYKERNPACPRPSRDDRLIGSYGSFDPFATPSRNDRDLRTAVAHCVAHARHKSSPTPFAGPPTEPPPPTCPPAARRRPCDVRDRRGCGANAGDRRKKALGSLTRITRQALHSKSQA